MLDFSDEEEDIQGLERVGVDKTKLSAVEDIVLDDPVTWLTKNRNFKQIEESATTRAFSKLSHSDKDKLFKVVLQTGQSQRRKTKRERRAHRYTLDNFIAKQSIWSFQKRQWRDVVNASINDNIVRRSDQAGMEQHTISRITCTICTKEDINTVTDCGHAFCKKCMLLWLDVSETCPWCWNFTKDTRPLHI